MRTAIVTFTLGIALFQGTSAAEQPRASAMPALIYAPMFDASTTWTFRVEVSVYGDADGPEPIKRTDISESTCHVTKVVRWASAIGSRIECDGALSAERVTNAVPAYGTFVHGDWVATKDGLWRFDEPVIDGSQPSLSPKRLVIAAQPVARKTHSEGGDGGNASRVWKTKSTWCSERLSWGGDESGDTYCFANATGLRAGEFYFAGGHESRVRFCVGPALCAMLST